jgi:hypothetical protein
VYKRVKHVALLSLYGVLVTARRIGVTPLVERVFGRSNRVRGRNHA